MSDISAVKALVFDVFGTVVDWRTSLINDFTIWGEQRGIRADWTALVDGWRAVYAASKAAVDVFTVGLAKEVAADGIRVNAVRPGMTRTDMTSDTLDDPVKHQAIAATIPIQRIAESSEVAKPILWLLSPEASFVTGALLDVSGGGFVIGPTAPRPGAVR